MDVCPVGGYIIVVTDAMNFHLGLGTTHIDRLWAYAPDGSGVVYNVQDTVNRAISAAVAIDCDDNGDIWVLGGHTYTGNFEGDYYLVKLTYTGGSPLWSSNFNPSNALIVHTYLDGASDICIDIAVDYQDERLYILHTGGTGVGKLMAVDISTGVPIYDPTNNVDSVFTNPIDVGSYYLGAHWWTLLHRNYAGIDIDHEETDREKCRIVCYGRLQNGTPQVARIAANGEILDRNNGSIALMDFSINNDSDQSVRDLTFPATDASARLWDTPYTW
jgi:hypothetical protein